MKFGALYFYFFVFQINIHNFRAFAHLNHHLEFFVPKPGVVFLTNLGIRFWVRVKIGVANMVVVHH